jgi:hypothetical protein
MSLIEIHSRLGNTALFYTIVMAAWGLWRYVRKQNVDSSYWGALVIAEVLYLAQGGLGAYLFLSGIGVLQRSIHILYGVVGVLVLPSIFAFTRGQDERRSMLVYGVGFLFLVGIVLRAITTAG